MSITPDIIRKLDHLRDMEPIPIGQLNNIDHMGLHLHAERQPRPKLYGRIIEIFHSTHVTTVKVRWNGQTDELRTDPEHVVRIESTPPKTPRTDHEYPPAQ